MGGVAPPQDGATKKRSILLKSARGTTQGQLARHQHPQRDIPLVPQPLNQQIDPWEPINSGGSAPWRAAEGELGGRDIVDADQLDLLGIASPSHGWHAARRWRWSRRRQTAPWANLPPASLWPTCSRRRWRNPAIEIALLHHTKALTVVEEGQLAQIRAIILTADITDALVSLGDEEVHYLLADQRQIHINRVKVTLRTAIHEHQLGRESGARRDALQADGR